MAGAVLDRRLFFLFHRAHRALFAHVNARVADALGVTTAQMGALHHVAKHEGCSPADIASLLDINKSAAGAMVRRLERGGMLRREPNPRDARGSRLFLTARGRQVRAESMPVIRKLTAEVCEGFSPEEVETVLRFLNAVVERYGEDEDA